MDNLSQNQATYRLGQKCNVAKNKKKSVNIFDNKNLK